MTDIQGSLESVYLLKRYCPKLETLQLGVRLDLFEGSLLPVDVDVFAHMILFLCWVITRAPGSLVHVTIGLDVQLHAPEGDSVPPTAHVERFYYHLLDQALSWEELPNLKRITVVKNRKARDGEWREPVETGVRRGLVRILKNAHEKSDLLQFNPEAR